MTRDEFKLIIKGLKSIYSDPKYISDQFAFDMWYQLLGDLDYKVASMATQAYMQTEHFPPTPADIRRYAEKITSPKTDDMSELEAWALVRKAVSNGAYGYKEEFEKLPEIIQKVIGRPENIREMSQLEVNELETVEQSHFVRNYRARLERNKQERQLQYSLQESIEQLRTENTPAIGVEEVPAIEDKVIDISNNPRFISENIQYELDKLLGRL